MNKRNHKTVNIFSIKNKMIGSLSAFSVIFLLVLCIISIYLASNSLLKNTQYFLKELTFSSSNPRRKFFVQVKNRIIQK